MHERFWSNVQEIGAEIDFQARSDDFSTLGIMESLMQRNGWPLKENFPSGERGSKHSPDYSALRTSDLGFAYKLADLRSSGRVSPFLFASIPDRLVDRLAFQWWPIRPFRSQ
jgi:hypothetical protein